MLKQFITASFHILSCLSFADRYPIYVQLCRRKMLALQLKTARLLHAPHLLLLPSETSISLEHKMII
jgi:hypothetical protein